MVFINSADDEGGGRGDLCVEGIGGASVERKVC
jgi:hypothetical protein